MVAIRCSQHTKTSTRFLCRDGLSTLTALLLLPAVLFGDEKAPLDACAAWGFEGVLVGAALKADGTIEDVTSPNHTARVEFVLHKPPRLKLTGQKGAEWFVFDRPVPRIGPVGAVVLEPSPEDRVLHGCEAAATRLHPVAKSVEDGVTVAAGRTDFSYNRLYHYGFSGRSCPSLFEIEKGARHVRVCRVNWFNDGSYHYLVGKLGLFGVRFDVSKRPLVFRIFDGRYVHVRGEGTATLRDGQTVQFSEMDSSGSIDGVISCKNVRFTQTARERGTLYFGKPEGQVGIGKTKEEAEEDLAPLQVGQLPEGNDILLVELQKPCYGLTTIYLNQRYRLHRATWELLLAKSLEEKLRKGEDSCASRLLKLLHWDSTLVRRASAKALAAADETAIDGLALALKDPDAEVRATAADSLASIGGAEVVDLLREALAGETDPNAREAIDNAFSIRRKN